jgi:phage terminase small subunit
MAPPRSVARYVAARPDNVPKPALTAKREVFIREYLVDFNGARAARAAGYSVRKADERARELLRMPVVRERIDAARKELDERLIMRREEVLRRLTSIGRSDLRKLYRDDGTVKPINEIDDETAMSIAVVEVEELFEGRGEDREHIGYLRKVKRYDAVRALELLGKHHALWHDQPPPAPEGPGMTIVVQNGVQVEGQRVTAATHVQVNLPGPER